MRWGMLFCLWSACGTLLAAPIESGLTISPSMTATYIATPPAVGDLNHDGREEVLIAGLATRGPTSFSEFTQVVQVLGFDGGRYRALATVPLPDAFSIYGSAVAAIPGGPGASGAVHVNGGVANVLQGWPLRVVRQLNVGANIRRAFVADIDGDSALELVLGDEHATGPRVHDFATGALEWTAASGGYIFTVAQLDADAAMEVVFPTGQVLDGLTRQYEWAPAPPIVVSSNAPPVVARHSAGQNAGFLVGGYDQLVVVRTGPYGVAGSINLPARTMPQYWAANLDGGNTDELVWPTRNEDFQGVIRVQSLATGAILEEPVVWNLLDAHWGVMADIDGNGRKELFYQPYNTDAWLVELMPFATRGRTVAELGPFVFDGPADIDQDGLEELAVMGTLGAFQNSGVIRLVDAAFGDERWSTAGSFTPAQDMSVAQMDADPQLETVSVNGESGNWIYVRDGVAGAIQLQRFVADMQPQRLATVSLDADTIPDLLIGGIVASPRAAHFVVRSGANDAELARLPLLGLGSVERIEEMRVVQLDADPALEVLASSGSRCVAYDLGTRSVQWTIPCLSHALTPVAGASAIEVAFVNADGVVQFRRASDLVGLRTLDFGDNVKALVDLGPGPAKYLVAVDGRLKAFTDDGTELAASGFSGHGLGHFNRLKLVARGPNRYTVWAASEIGVHEFTVDLNEPPVFADGFE